MRDVGEDVLKVLKKLILFWDIGIQNKNAMKEKSPKHKKSNITRPSRRLIKVWFKEEPFFRESKLRKNCFVRNKAREDTCMSKLNLLITPGPKHQLQAQPKVALSDTD